MLTSEASDRKDRGEEETGALGRSLADVNLTSLVSEKHLTPQRQSTHTQKHVHSIQGHYTIEDLWPYSLTHDLNTAYYRQMFSVQKIMQSNTFKDIVALNLNSDPSQFAK